MTDTSKTPAPRESVWKLIPMWAPLALMVAGGLAFGVRADGRLNDDHDVVTKHESRIQALETQRAVDQRTLEDHTKRLDRIECKLDRVLAHDPTLACDNR